MNYINLLEELEHLATPNRGEFSITTPDKGRTYIIKVGKYTWSVHNLNEQSLFSALVNIKASHLKDELNE